MGGSKQLAALERRGTCGALVLSQLGWMGGEGMTEVISGLEGHTVSFPCEDWCPSFPLVPRETISQEMPSRGPTGFVPWCTEY